MVSATPVLITASNTKGQKEAEKGLKGNHQKNTPLVPFYPFWSLSLKRQRLLTTQTFPSTTTQFLVRRGQMQRSAKKMRMGYTLAYCPFAFIFVSGSRCAPYHKKLKEVFSKTTLSSLLVDWREVMAGLLHNFDYAVERDAVMTICIPVSYTHLTLPTITAV